VRRLRTLEAPVAATRANSGAVGWRWLALITSVIRATINNGIDRRENEKPARAPRVDLR